MGLRPTSTKAQQPLALGQLFFHHAKCAGQKNSTGDLVLIHCNSYLNGYWTDITRTFCVGPMDERKQRSYEAIFAARAAALAAIHPGVRGRDVDRAAQVMLSRHGFVKEFRHGLGHGVGFAAINHNAVPRLHPASDDLLEPGMIFNIEPAGYFGLRWHTSL